MKLVMRMIVTAVAVLIFSNLAQVVTAQANVSTVTPEFAAAPGHANVREVPYLAAGDGKTDDSSAFQRALDQVGSEGGGLVFVPTGRYMIKSHLSVPAGTSLVGVGERH